MANMAYVQYKIEGPQEILKTIHDVCQDCLDSNEDSEYTILERLGAEELESFILRGYINYADEYDEEEYLSLYADEAWGLSDFSKVLELLFPDIIVYWYVEEPGCEVYETNDEEGKYFPNHYCVEYFKDGDLEDTCYDIENEKELFKTISDMTGVSITNQEELDKFNEDDMTYVNVHEIQVI